MRTGFLIVVLSLLVTSSAVAQDRPVEPPPEPPPAVDVDGGFFVHGGVGGLYAENVGVTVGGHLTLDHVHSVELAVSLAGGNYLLTAAQIRYRLQITELVAWHVEPFGIAFEFLFPDAQTLLWSRLSTFSTGVEITLLPELYLGIDLTFVPRVYPLAITFVERDGEPTREITHEPANAVFDITQGLLRPGVVLGFRL